MATIVKGNLKALFSVSTTPGLLHFTLNLYFIMLSVKQGSIKYHFLRLWYDTTWDWTPSLLGHWQTLYPLGQWTFISKHICKYVYIYKNACVCKIHIFIYRYDYVHISIYKKCILLGNQMSQALGHVFFNYPFVLLNKAKYITMIYKNMLFVSQNNFFFVNLPNSVKNFNHID